MVTSQILNNLEVLIFRKVEIDERIMQTLSLIIRSNFIKELEIIDCKIGTLPQNTTIDKLIEAFSFNTSLISLKLDSDEITDE
jgi:hypothetical protein